MHSRLSSSSWLLLQNAAAKKLKLPKKARQHDEVWNRWARLLEQDQATIRSTSSTTTTTTWSKNRSVSSSLLRPRPWETTAAGNSMTRLHNNYLHTSTTDPLRQSSTCYSSWSRHDDRPLMHVRYFHSSHSNFNNIHNASHNIRCFSAIPSPHRDDDDDEIEGDEEDWSLDAEIERLASSCFPYEEFDDSPASFLQEQRQRLEHASSPSSSLDLELGETSIWDVPTGANSSSSSEMVEEEEDSIVISENEDERLQFPEFPEFPEGTPAAEWRRRQLAPTQLKHKPVLSPLDMLEQLSLDPQQQQQQQPTTTKLDPLSYAGPVAPDMEQVQLQLECEAQREAVAKYQKMTEQTRARKDYASLNSLQKLILNWYSPIRDEIDHVQQQYLFYKINRKKRQKKQLKSKSSERNNDNDDDTNNNDTNNNDKIPTAMTKYGPLLSAVDPEKLAVITTHEALTLCILKTKEHNNYFGGCPVVLLAKTLGQAVETEVLLQRILKRSMEEERVGEKTKEESNEKISAFAKELSLHPPINGEVDGNYDGEEGEDLKPFAYAESRLTSYLQQLAGDGSDKSISAKNRKNIAKAVRKARQVLDTKSWSQEDHVHVGSILLKILLEHATIRLPDGTFQPAFRMKRRYQHTNWGKRDHENGSSGDNKKARFNASNVIMAHDALWKLAVADEFESIAATTTRHKPMVVPPKAWTSPEDGGYAWLSTELVRFHGSQLQREALDQANLTTVLDGLNSLSREAWKINKTVLQVAEECWENNIPLGDIPSRTDLLVPPEPTPPEKSTFVTTDNPEVDEGHNKLQKQQWVKEYTAYREALNRHRRVLQKNRDLFSLRCSAQLKLGQAKQFQDYEKIYFPYNMDFRGRAYPVPPHLSNVGSDLCRGMLTFAKKKPLGKRGLFWLQVHLANLAGKDKMTFEDRAQYTIDNLDNVRKAVEDTFGQLKKAKNKEEQLNAFGEESQLSTFGEEEQLDIGKEDYNDNEEDDRPWWMSLDDPFQGLATCHEIINAIDSGDPETYMCSLPVHMDGSCNGLQHYAALGRDTVGGTAVNLCNKPEPQDVYIGVMEEVIRRVAEEAARELDFDETSLSEDDKLSKKQKKELSRNRSAKLVNGLLDRGVVKRTVMTSVYGVTYIGARQQIQEKIEEKLEEQGRDLDEINYEIFRASGYLAEVTMNVIGDLFTGAKETMNWLTQCARLLSAKGHPVAWMTPLGLPAVQPYRQKRASRIVTALSSMIIADYSDDLPIHKSRSVSAFPPNYIHSLDSTHMLMTALEMDRRGLCFSAVHDSFWTHPCDVDEMNEALRDMFIELYSQPLLEDLKESFEMRYPDIEFPDLPEKGNLDLNEVRDSKFFFQ